MVLLYSSYFLLQYMFTWIIYFENFYLIQYFLLKLCICVGLVRDIVLALIYSYVMFYKKHCIIAGLLSVLKKVSCNWQWHYHSTPSHLIQNWQSERHLDKNAGSRFDRKLEQLRQCVYLMCQDIINIKTMCHLFNLTSGNKLLQYKKGLKCFIWEYICY